MSGKNLPGKLILVRHGQSVWNVENLFTGWHDVDLSDQGRLEAKSAGVEIKKAGLVPDICFTSTLKRAIRTLWTVLDEMDLMWLPVERSWRLNERHYGALQGLDKAQTVEKHGEAQVKIWRRSYDIPPPPLPPADPRHPVNDRATPTSIRACCRLPNRSRTRWPACCRSGTTASSPSSSWARTCWWPRMAIRCAPW